MKAFALAALTVNCFGSMLILQRIADGHHMGQTRLLQLVLMIAAVLAALFVISI